ncbi:acylneuraminate cytidylyltransferase family protein [Flavobacteriaceae bacterium]|nr:acylneuraminate cytidylyltransferase family protein [Flavobacteriaceae bacterium]
MEVLAIIPARSGSKGIPGKNWKSFDGKPLIQYSIDSARKSCYISEIIVSTDSLKILDILKNNSFVKIHNRSGILSSDESPITDTIHEIINLQTNKPEYILLLQPTSPLRTGSQIDNALDLLINNPYLNSIVSVIKMDDIHPARMYWENFDDMTLKPVLANNETSRRQDIEPAFYRNGAIYIVRTESFLKTQKLMCHPLGGYVMNNKSWLNIDDDRDLIIAESLIKNWKNENCI